MAVETIESLISKKEALDAVLDSIERWAIFFAVVVGIGVCGEAIYSARAWWNNRKLHVVQHAIDQLRQAEVARLTSEAESSRALIAQAGAQSAEANRKAEAFRLDIAKANERAAEAEKGTAEAKLELAKMQADRHFTK